MENEGFNPSDDGVILAQSFRILNGEVPHRDFISIRPVFSGVLHTLHFFSPFPLVVSGRVFVLLEFFVFSFIWLYILFDEFGITFKSRFLLLTSSMALGIISFLLNLNTFILFPWATIDGILLATISLLLLLKGHRQPRSTRAKTYLGLSLIFISLAALAKQSFVILTVAIFFYVSCLLKKCHARASSALMIVLAGVSPFVLYLSLLFWDDSLSLFLQQMTGRTELISTGVITYVRTFIGSRLLLPNLALLGVSLFNWINHRLAVVSSKWVGLLHRIAWGSVLAVYLISILYFSFSLLHTSDRSLTFELFWILFTLSVTALSFLCLSQKQSLVLVFGLFLSWSSSISLGANYPIFTTAGTSGITASVLVYLLAAKFKVALAERGYPLLSGSMYLLLAVSFFVVALQGQRSVNYRDLPSAKLTYNLGEVLPEFGDIKTNATTYDYYADFMRIYSSFDDIKDHFVCIPNNAIIYPVLKSRNPFPLDWLQRDEYVGSERYLLNEVSRVLDSEKVYLIVDKYESKTMAYGLSEKEYDVDDYAYMDFVFSKTKEIPTDSKYFRIYTNFRE